MNEIPDSDSSDRKDVPDPCSPGQLAAYDVTIRSLLARVATLEEVINGVMTGLTERSELDERLLVILRNLQKKPPGKPDDVPTCSDELSDREGHATPRAVSEPCAGRLSSRRRVLDGLWFACLVVFVIACGYTAVASIWSLVSRIQ